VVTDADTGQPLDAIVTVAGNAQQVSTDPDHGDYYKLLDTGTYTLTFAADGYVPRTVNGVSTVWGVPTVVDVALVSALSEVPARGGDVLRITASPNPFNPRTTLSLTIPDAGPVAVAIYDVQGRLIRRLHTGPLAAGTARIVWDGSNEAGGQAPSGIYFSQVVGGAGRATAKLALVR
jgi:hypothetical protein